MATKENFMKALADLRAKEAEKKDKIKFDQTLDLIINLKDYDIKKNSINTFVMLPHKFKDKRVAAFFEKKSSLVDTITKDEFDNFKDKKKMKKLVKEYDFFLASAKLMPSVAASFGRVLGPFGKMPSPQLGVLMTEDPAVIKSNIEKIDKAIKLRTKEPSIKVSIGKQSSKDEDLAENAVMVYNEVFKNLPKNKENLRNVLIKFTMSKPVKVAI
jgi:large subunit ribosomal protein L1